MSDITQEDLDRAIRELAKEQGIEWALSLPGVWEIVAEDLNNDAIDRCAEENDQ